MSRSTILRSTFACLAVALLSGTAQAQLFRTYLSSTGNDANPCTVQALAAAVAYRDLMLAHHSQFEHRVWVRTRLRRNNRSGIPGVGRYEVLANPKTGRREAFWQAAWVNEQGLSRKRKFAVSRYGEQHAKRLAIAERERQLLRVCAIKDGSREARSLGRRGHLQAAHAR